MQTGNENTRSFIKVEFVVFELTLNSCICFEMKHVAARGEN